MRFQDGDDAVFYVNPEGIEESLLQNMKQHILSDGLVAEFVVFEETNCARFRDILAQARADGLTHIFFILNRASAEKMAVLAVEPTHCTGEEKVLNFDSPVQLRRANSTFIQKWLLAWAATSTLGICTGRTGLKALAAVMSFMTSQECIRSG